MRPPGAGTRARSVSAGFTLVEVLIAAMVTVVALSLAVALLVPASAAFQALPESIDNQQRMRIAATAIAGDISDAGAGPVLGWGATATQVWPALLPCRWTAVPLASLPGGCARDDAVTVMMVAAEAPHGMVVEASGTGEPLHLGSLSACDLARSACRFDEDTRALIVDGRGRWDVFTVTSVSADGAWIGHAKDVLSQAAEPGSLVAAVAVRSYSLKADPSTGVVQLRRGSGGASDVPVADQVTGLAFAYFAEAAPPAVITAGSPERRSTTYGPLPPPPGVDDPGDRWPAGENCVFRLDGASQVPRLASLSGGEYGLAELPLAAMTDGPWCPDEVSPNRWDADLIRLRLVRVSLRVQPQSPSVRGVFSLPGGPTPPLDVLRWVPDLEVRVDVAIRSRLR